MDNNFTKLLESYKNNFVAYGLNKSNQNKSMLDNAEQNINGFFSKLNERYLILEKENERKRDEITELNKIIKKSKKQHKALEHEKDFLVNSDLGALEQDKNQYHIFKNKRLQLILEVCLIVVILIFLYINDNIVPSIRGRFSKKTQ
jgi:hypothetical protein